MNGKSPLHATPDRLERLASALVSLGKLLKAVRFYPSGHPALQAACQEARDQFAPLLCQGGLTLAVRKTGFYWQEEPVGAERPALRDLAFFFFARLTHRLLILPELTGRDLESFARCAVGEPADIQRAGGLQELLLQAHVCGLYLNEIDLQTVQASREILSADEQEEAIDLDGEQTEELPEAEAPAVPELAPEELYAIPADPAELLTRLEKERSDKGYRLLCQKLVAILPEHLHEPDLATPRKALLMLARHSADKARNNSQRRFCLETLEQLANPELLRFFINALCDKQQNSAGRAGLLDVLSVLQEKAALALVERLITEDNSQARKLLGEALVKLGNWAVPALVERLADEHWYVVRNAVAILGRIRNRKTAIYIRPYIDHRDHRVRLEAVRALGRIGGPVALKGLLQLVDNRDRELAPLALAALGAMRSEAATEPLLKLIKSRDPLLKHLALKMGAIKALGAIGSHQAVPLLVKILKGRRLWKRNQYNMLRSSAAQALGNIADAAALPALETASQDGAPLVAHAAREALARISTRTEHEP